MAVIIGLLCLALVVNFTLERWDSYALKNIQYHREFKHQRVFEGDHNQLITEVVNQKVLPLPWLKLTTLVPWQFEFIGSKTAQVRADELAEHSMVSSLLFYERLKRTDKFICKKRGYFHIYQMTVEVGDLMGLVKAQKQIPTDLKLWVYPEIKPLQSLIKEFKSLQGNVSVRRWIMPDPMVVTGARLYRQSDPFQMIDWKTTARTNALHVKQLDFTADQSMMVFLDVQSQEIYWRDIQADLIEESIRICASIINESLREKIAIGFCANTIATEGHGNIYIPISQSLAHRQQLFDAMASVSHFRSLEMQNLLHQKTQMLDQQTAIVLVTSYLSEPLVHQINRLARLGYQIKLILMCDDFNPNRLDRRVQCLFANHDLIDEGASHGI